jgi:membrane protease YdiL (CAAX protease family)
MATTTATPSRATAGVFPLKYFALAFAITWVFWVPAALEARGLIPSLPIPATFLGAFGPLLAAVVVTAQDDGRVGLRSLLGRVLRWRVPPIWYGVTILGPILLYLTAMALNVALGGQPPDLEAMIGALPIVLAISVYMLIAVALGEEVGWRGYALPALQARYSALLASVILGVMWALWHLPLFFNPDTIYGNLPFVVQLALQVPLAILLTWVYNSTQGSVLMVMLFHAVFNAGGQFWKTIPAYSIEPSSAAEAAARTFHVNLMVVIVLWVAAVVVVLVYGSRNLSRDPRQVSADTGDESRPQAQ